VRWLNPVMCEKSRECIGSITRVAHLYRSSSFVEGIVMATSGVRSRKQGPVSNDSGPEGI
jgi:hypothetical protein